MGFRNWAKITPPLWGDAVLGLAVCLSSGIGHSAKVDLLLVVDISGLSGGIALVRLSSPAAGALCDALQLRHTILMALPLGALA